MEAMGLAPDDPDVHNELGIVWLKFGKLTDAAMSFQAALKYDPTHLEAQANLDNTLDMIQKVRGNLSEINNKLSQNPGSQFLHYEAGGLHDDLGEIDQAVLHYQLALKIQPDYADAVEKLAHIYILKKDLSSAVSLFEKLVEISPDSKEIYYNIACLYSMQQKPAQSIEWLKKAMENGFDDRELLINDPRLNNIRHESYYQEIITEK
jgi:tetratricopeptide (TPR) repeat protein